MKHFPPFRLDLVNECLWRKLERRPDERVTLTPKAFAVLRYLVEHAGQLVTHDQLLDEVWRATYVQPQAVKREILYLRRALGDRPKKAVYIETLHRRGYRFVAAVRESAETGVVVPSQRLSTKMVGRERPLSELREHFEKAIRGERQSVFITGEPGIGKTALADEFQRRLAAELPALRIARGQCIEGYGGKEPYYPMLEALGKLCRGAGGEQLIQILAIDAPTWLVQFPGLLSREQRDTLQREILGATRDRMLREIGDALDVIASANPLLLVFEDLQWVDRSTIDLISALARSRATAKVMLICTERPLNIADADHPLRSVKEELLSHNLCHEITLKPLREAEIPEYLGTASSETELPSGLAKFLYDHTEGNPLFLLTALEHMSTRGLTSRTNAGWKLNVPIEEIALEVPKKLRRMIETQIDTLRKEEQRALEAGSVEGVVFSTGASSAAANLTLDAFEEVCERLSRRQHIIESAGSRHASDGSVFSSYKFVHGLYREVCYTRQAPGRRAKLHRQIGGQLEILFSDHLNEVAPQLQIHFEAAGDWPRTVKYLRIAAETAWRRFANREATVTLERALEVCAKLAETDRVVRELDILELLGLIYAGEFDTRAIERFQSVAARSARCNLVEAEARALIGLAYAFSWISLDRCLEVLSRALLLADLQSSHVMRAHIRVTCLFFRIWAAGWNPHDAEECRTALDKIREGDSPIIFSHDSIECSLLQWASSHYREANRKLPELTSKLLGIAETDHLNVNLAFWAGRLFSSCSLMFLGEWGNALEGFTKTIATLDKNGDEYLARIFRLYLAWTHLQMLNVESVLQICESSFSDPEKSAISASSVFLSPLPEAARICLILKGSAHVLVGKLDCALDDLLAAQHAMDQQKVIKDWYWRMPLESSLAELWLAKRDAHRARSHAKQFLYSALATAERTWQALAWETNARVAITDRDLERANECLATALQTMDDFEVPLAEWRVHATAANLYEMQGDKSSARHHFELSRTTIMKLADSLGPNETFRNTFLCSPVVSSILRAAANC
jgi:DNA-binding winged helix-turn-helix (wHTH) protein/tetratricopeptide (TPR) repeat protein